MISDAPSSRVHYTDPRPRRLAPLSMTLLGPLAEFMFFTPATLGTSFKVGKTDVVDCDKSHMYVVMPRANTNKLYKRI